MSQAREAAMKGAKEVADTSLKPIRTKQVNQQSATATTSETTASMKTQTKLVANLHSAANEGKVELVRLLLRCGANVNSQDEQYGNTALHQAAWNGFSQTIQMLCKYRANTSIKNKAQFTPLHLACQQGHNQTARLLLMANAKTEAKNSYGDTPLHTAARYGHAGVARILLSASCNPNQVNKNHDTPLHIAAAMNRRKLTKIFMQNGAEPAVKNKQNETAMDIALRKDLIDIQELIANPPPVRSARRSNLLKSDHRQLATSGRLSQLEQRFGSGQLCTTAPKLANHNGRRTLANGRHHRRNQHMSSDDDDQPRCSQRPMSSRRQIYELPVDVPGEGANSKHGRRFACKLDEPRLVNGSSHRFSSLHSLSANAAPQKQLQQQQAHLQRRLRTRTLAAGSGADLHLLPALMARCKLTRTSNRGDDDGQPDEDHKGSTGDEPADDGRRMDASEACLPDARDSPAEWADMMAGSALRGGLVSDADVIDGRPEESPDGKTARLAAKPRQGLGKSGGKSLSSPVGSFRSNLSKSQNRSLLLRHRQRTQKCSLLVRRPNLGTCVGKLSLLRLRGATNKRRPTVDGEHEATGEQADEFGTPEAAGNGCQAERRLDSGQRNAESGAANEIETPKPAAEQDGSANNTTTATSMPTGSCQLGRRQERLERAVNSANAPRAPNGTPLLVTRPLAALNDDTQLYAIPKKVKSKQQELVQVEAAGDQAASKDKGNRHKGQEHSAGQLVADRAKDTGGQQPPVRVASGGPALTSDGGLSSSAGSSASSLARGIAPSSSNIASSSDECIESMDLVCVNKLTSSLAVANQLIKSSSNTIELDSAPTGDFHRPALVGVHADKELCNVAPGYSVVGERPRQRLNPQNTAKKDTSTNKPCLCQRNNPATSSSISKNDRCQETQGESAKESSQSSSYELKQQTKQQVGGTKSNKEQSKTSKLRQLLHLETRANKSSGSKDCESKLVSTTSKCPPNTRSDTSASSQQKVKLSMSAIAGGYYAYSPVVQSTSELQDQVNPANQVANEQGGFTESGNSTTATTTTTSTTKSAPKRSWLMSKFSLSSSNINHESSAADASGPGKPRESCKTVRADCNDKESVSSSSALLGPPERKAELISIGAPALNSHRSQVSDEPSPRLIRPKSALSATSADLIAAQKSLAAAAAAKVRRDRLVRIGASSGGDEVAAIGLNESADATCRPNTNAGKEGVLTVKTSDPFWSNHNHGASHAPMLVAGGVGGPKFMLAEPRNRSGTNSVGMSDSSPSNNGAESDNSIQTTSGSLATDNTSGGQPFSGEQTNLSPLGILSRILLNNKSISTSAQSGTGYQQRQADETDSSGSTLKADGSSNLALLTPIRTSNQKLDQLSSRSRCPIVATNSNGSEMSDSSQPLKDQPVRVAGQENGCAPPPLPAKGVLKPASNGSNKLAGFDRDHSGFSRALIESMNGLPRVASQSQLASIGAKHQLMGPGNGGLGVLDREQQLCNYHAMNRNQAPLFVGNPSLLGPYNSNYPTAAAAVYRGQPTLNRYHRCDPTNGYPQHMSQHDLRSFGMDQGADITSAINYEYFLESAPPLPINGYQQHSIHPASRYHYIPNDCSTIYPELKENGQNLDHDDSIYIPYVNAGQPLRDNSSSGGVAVRNTAGHFQAPPLSLKPTGASYLNLRNHLDAQQQQRPKSSLDNFHLSSVNQSATDGRRLSTSSHNQADSVSHAFADYPANSKLAATAAYYSPYGRDDIGLSGYLYAQSSIYADDQSSERFRCGSDLTVLPTTPDPVPAGFDSPPSTSDASSSSSSFQQRHHQLQPSTEGQSKVQLSRASRESSSEATMENGVGQILPSQSKPGHVNPAMTVIIDRKPMASADGKQVAWNRQAPLAKGQQQINSWTSTPYKSLVKVNQTSPSQPAKSNQSSTKVELAPQQRPTTESTGISSITVTNSPDRNHRPQATTAISNQVNSTGCSSSKADHSGTELQASGNKSSSIPADDQVDLSSVRMSEECNGSTVL